MASTLAQLPPPTILFNSRPPLFATLQRITMPTLEGKKIRYTIVAKATGESSESSNSLSIVESVQNVWNKSEDRIALIGLGFAAIVGLWASANLVAAIDKLPLVPSALELVGILYSSWFVYQYLLFKPDREEFFRGVGKYISDILGQ
ncbi:hypothetical protein Leryth_001931 [Lithospermum erythrorhizon]|nr:hypothetical protein Leryth_001931 [Lithospermum erythrorhizon]